MPGTVSEHKLTKDQVVVAEAVFNAAKKACGIIAHCHVILALKGADQKIEAAKLLAKERDVPEMLRIELGVIGAETVLAKRGIGEQGKEGVTWALSSPRPRAPENNKNMLPPLQ